MLKLAVRTHGWVLGIALACATPIALAVPTVEETATHVTIAAPAYRLSFRKGFGGFALAVKGRSGEWVALGESGKRLSHTDLEGVGDVGEFQSPALLKVVTRGPHVVAGQTWRLPTGTSVLETHCVCTEEGILLSCRLIGPAPKGMLWPIPRMRLDPHMWQTYAFWDSAGRAHAGRLTDLAGYPSYAGVTTWGTHGDLITRLDAVSPGLFIGSGDGLGLGVVFVNYGRDWTDALSFVQRYTADTLFFYPAVLSTERGGQMRWAWLVPVTLSDPSLRDHAQHLAREGEAMAESFSPVVPPVPEEWTRPVPEFPAHLRRNRPVEDIGEATVYTMAETTRTPEALDMAARVGSEVLIRGWFKWANAPELDTVRDIPERAHRLGALFGGGITCSALYDSENGITREQLLDMATRGPDGELVDAWGVPGIRHGSLSSPAYLDYLFRWCREQIDAGVDLLFMDEHTAALAANEGFDDHSIADFRRYLLETRQWAPTDARWKTELAIDFADPRVCPSGDMRTFHYRAYLKVHGFTAEPWSASNPLAPDFARFREQRDREAWRKLTQRIRDYATSLGRKVLISANGFAPFVDLQVAGTWDDMMIVGQGVDLEDDAIPRWRSRVMEGQRVAGRKVPVVFFHDWGMGDPPFPFLSLPPAERALWIRVRGAEVYAAGGFFAFPVLGPFGCNALADGTLETIQKQAIFYRTNRELYLKGEFVASDELPSSGNRLSFAVWRSDGGKTLMLHLINRVAREGRPIPRTGLRVTLPVSSMPDASWAVSPDWAGRTPVRCTRSGRDLVVNAPDLEAYAVIVLKFRSPPDTSRLRGRTRIYPPLLWERPRRAMFNVRPDGTVEDASALPGYLQGMLHTHLRQPPTFIVNAKRPCVLRLKVRAVAAAGAKLRVSLDGRVVLEVDLPDRDGKNDARAPEYDRVIQVRVPAGNHHVTLDNVGPDWLSLWWLEWQM